MISFTSAHRQTETFSVLQNTLNEELERLRSRLEGKLDFIETERIRGRIEGIRFVLSLGKEKQRLEADVNLGF